MLKNIIVVHSQSSPNGYFGFMFLLQPGSCTPDCLVPFFAGGPVAPRHFLFGCGGGNGGGGDGGGGDGGGGVGPSICVSSVVSSISAARSSFSLGSILCAPLSLLTV